MNTNPLHLDSGESIFFKRELEHVKTRSYDTKFKELKAFSLFPISAEASSGNTEITYRKYTGVGVAKIIADYAHDFPRVDVYGEETTVKIKDVGASYGYSIKEIRASQMTGKRLEQRRADAARRAIDEKINDIAFSGDSKSGLQGFINYPGISEYTIPADGTGSSKLWSTKTPDQIVRDMAGIVSGIVDSTNGRETPDTLLLPIAQYQYIANTRMSDNTDKTILAYFLANNPFIKRVEWVVELNAAGTGATDRMMAYAKDDMHLTLEIPRVFESFDPVQKGMEFEVPCHAETAGIIVYYPLSVAYGDGI